MHEALRQKYDAIPHDASWGRPWGTTWFRLTGAVPADWSVGEDERLELILDLGFTDARAGFQAEGLLWSEEGRVLKGIEPLQHTFTLPEHPGDDLSYLLEAAANPDIAQDFSFRPTPMGDPETAGNDHIYRLGGMEIGVRHMPTWLLIQDLASLTALASELSAGGRTDEILTAVSRALNIIDPSAVRTTVHAARAELAPMLARPAHASAHRIHAVGHAHIDSAWLWPLRETKRKVARSFSNVLALMDRYPEMTFVASSAQQYAWIKADYPELYERVKARVNDGRFIPSGGQWIEPDCNLPSGESMARQLIEGKRFFLDEFGIEPPEVWVPDSFGYSASLPQIAAAAGSRYFLTQKISWNETNRFPHHSFLWEGIDGTRIFTHFPPADTYHAHVSAQELLLADAQLTDRGKKNVSLLPFGWGDGGGGPTEEMVESAARFADLEGAPRVSHSTPERFFADVTEDYDDPPVWVGELYLERHRGVSTTQIQLKRGNRLSERLLREAEYWCTVASVRNNAPYPAEDLRRIWREVLLLQFHDILPGSSIAWVHREAAERYSVLHQELGHLIDAAVRRILGDGSARALLNAGPLALDGVVSLGAASPSRVGPTSDSAPQARWLDAGRVELDNGILRVIISANGEIESLVDIGEAREIVPRGTRAGRLELHHDTPTTWDAWDLDEHYLQRVIETSDDSEITIVDALTDASAATVTRAIGASSARMEYRLSVGSPRLEITIDLDWREDQKLLKYVIPVDVHADRAASEVAYGHIFRATHTNTSWDEARFETVAHRWLHVGEPGYGISLANESTYGYRVAREEVSNGAVCTTIGVSLARAPRYPDPESDRGHHSFRFALRPGADVADAVAEGYRLNVPLREVSGVGTSDVVPLVSLDGAPGVMTEAVKLADDGSGDVVVRLYEAHGNRATGTLRAAFDAVSANECDLLERPTTRRDGHERHTDGAFDFTLRPFQLVTFRIQRGGNR